MALAIPLVTDTSLREGDFGLAVFSLQRAANKLGVKIDGEPIAEDLSFGPKTKRAAVVLQRLVGTDPDGLFGPISQALLSKWICEQQQLKSTTYLPKGLLLSNVNYESGGYLGSVDWSVSGGVDVGITSRRLYTEQFKDDAIVLAAFDSHVQVAKMAADFNTVYTKYLPRAGVKGNKELASRLAVLTHNYPAAADNFSRYGVPKETVDSVWTRPASWITNLPYKVKFVDGFVITTPLQWCQRYSLGNAAHREPGQAVKLVTAY